MVSVFYWFVLKQFLGWPIVFVLNKCISFRSLIDILRETRQKLFSDIWNIAFKRPFWTESATYRLTVFPFIIIYRNKSWLHLQAYYIKMENVWYDMIHASFKQLLELILSWLLYNTSPKSQYMSTYTFNKIVYLLEEYKEHCDFISSFKTQNISNMCCFYPVIRWAMSNVDSSSPGTQVRCLNNRN